MYQRTVVLTHHASTVAKAIEEDDFLDYEDDEINYSTNLTSEEKKSYLKSVTSVRKRERAEAKKIAEAERRRALSEAERKAEAARKKEITARRKAEKREREAAEQDLIENMRKKARGVWVDYLHIFMVALLQLRFLIC